MAKKRKSSLGPDSPTPFDTNNTTRGLQTDFEKLCKDALLDIPSKERHSPLEHPSLLWKTYMFLWWRNRSKLDDVINELMEDLLSMQGPQRVQYLLSQD